jgi:hypothetical protein
VVVGSFYRPFRPAFYDPWFYGPYWGGGGFGLWGGYPFPPAYYGGGVWDLNSSLRIQATPREAEVFVDGYFAGVVNNFDGVFQRLRLEPGEHTLELFHPGYRPVQQSLYLQPGITTHVREALVPLAPGDPAPVRPEGGPRRSPVRMDERRQLPPDPPPAPRAERPGPEFLDDGGRDIAPGFGQLALRVQPSDAEIFVDGERWEGSAADERLVLQLGAGTHHIEVRKNGYRSYLSDINVRDGQSLPINIALTRQ